MSKAAFKRVVSGWLWREEWTERVSKMAASSRLWQYADRMVGERMRWPAAHERRAKWRPAPYLRHVGSRRNARQLAMCRLGLLPVELERGRWTGTPRDERCCEECGAPCGDVQHLLGECAGVPEPERGVGVWEVVTSVHRGVSGRSWRAAAREVERRWVWKRERGQWRGREDEESEPASEPEESVADESEVESEHAEESDESESTESESGEPGSGSEEEEA